MFLRILSFHRFPNLAFFPFLFLLFNAKWEWDRNVKEGAERGREREREERCPCVDLRIGTPVDATRNRLDDVKRRLDKRVALSHYEEKGLLPFFSLPFSSFFFFFFFYQLLRHKSMLDGNSFLSTGFKQEK